MRYLLRTAAVAAAAALTVAGLSPAGAVEPAVSLSQAGPTTVWGIDPTLGSADPTDLAVPPELQQRGIRAIAVTQDFAVAATADGHVTAWGDAQAVHYHAVPAPEGLSDVVDVKASVGASTYNALALTAAGRVVAWGSGNSDTTQVPDDIQGQVKAIYLSGDYAAALTDGGRIVQWGTVTAEPQYAVPDDIQGQVVDMAISADAGVAWGSTGTPNLALLTNGTVRTWGNPTSAAVDAAWTVPSDIQGHVVKVVSGPDPAAILADGSVRFWGRSSSTETGVPAYISGGQPAGFPGGTEPVADPVTDPVTDLQLGCCGYAMALTAAGDAYLWGSSGLRSTDAAMQVSLTGPVRTGVSAISLSRSEGAAVVTTGLAIGSDPVVTGTAYVGQTLTATPGTFSGPQDYSTSSQWLEDDVAIDDDADTLTLTAADLGKTVTYQTTADNGDKTVVATSSPMVVSQESAPPPNTTPPPTGGGTPALTPQQQKLTKDQATLKKAKAKLKKAKKAYKKAHGAKKAKLKKKIKKLKKTVKKDKKLVKADS